MHFKKTEDRPERAVERSFFYVPETGTLRKGKLLSRNRNILLSFAVPFVLMFIAFAIMGCEPFGDKQILVTDLWHQYFPFLVDFQDKLKHGESLLWSWTQGGGTNYLALASYYLASPLNFLTVLLPSSLFGADNITWLNMFLTFSVALKIGLAGGFFAYFLRSVFKRDDLSLILFSTSFALSAFFMGYYWCEIWLDTVALTPLVVLGFYSLMTEGKYRLYTITLALSLLANYYIGLFTCVFMVLCFIGYQICAWKRPEIDRKGTTRIKRILGYTGDFFKFSGKRLARIAIWSVVGAMMTTFLLLPAFFGLQNTHAAGSTFPAGYTINIGSTADLGGTLDAIRRVISNTSAFVAPTTTEGLPNVACGVISVILGIMFMVSKKITIREKIFNGCLLLFLILSFIIRPLDYMWHGFHFTNMIPYRFSYLVSFILVVMAFRAFDALYSFSFFDVLITALVTVLVVLCCINVQEILPIILTSAISLVILALLFLYTRRILSKNVLCMLLALIVLGQSGVTAYLGVKTTSVTSTPDYPRARTDTAVVVDHMKEIEKKTPELWRAEFTSTQTLCDSSLNRFNGFSMFNSMANESITRFTENFGLIGWLSGNRYTYAESSPISNVFMNFKYLIARDGTYNDTNHLSETFASNNVKLCLNKSYIPMGMVVNDNLLNFRGEDPEDSYNPFEKQNQFFRYATGINKDAYTSLDVVSQGHTDYNLFPVNRLDYGSYSFSTKDSNTAPHLKWNYEAQKSGYYYAYVQITDGTNLNVYCNDALRSGTSSFFIKRPYIMSIGYFEKGDKISLYCDLKAGATGSAKVYVNYFNEDVFDEGYYKLNESVMKTTKLTGTSMEGEIYAVNDGLFYTSIPYESGRTENDTLIGKLFGCDNEGWTATVDGEPVKVEPLSGALVTFKMSKGKHTVSINYIPKGFIKGTAISVLGLAIFVGWTLFLHFRKKKKTKSPV